MKQYSDDDVIAQYVIPSSERWPYAAQIQAHKEKIKLQQANRQRSNLLRALGFGKTRIVTNSGKIEEYKSTIPDEANDYAER